MNKILKFITDYFWIFFALAILAGIFLPAMSIFSPYILYLLMFVLLLSCLKMDMGEIFNRIKDFKIVFYLVFLVLIISPLIVYPIFNLFLDWEYSLAILILAAMPAGMAVPVYATIFNGDKELALIISAITLLSCPLTIPLLMYFLVGVKTNIDPIRMFINLSLIIFIPFILGCFFKKIAKEVIRKTQQYYSPLSILVMVFVIGGAVAMIGVKNIIDGGKTIILPFLSLFLLSIILHIIGYLAMYKKSNKSKITSSLAIAYMNATLAIVFTAQFFGPKTLFLVTLYQIPINTGLISFGYFVKKYLRK